MKNIVLFLAITASVTYTYAQKSNQNCVNDNECSGDNWICGENRKCKCSVSFREGPNQQCVKVLGTNCQASDECANMPGATCENNKCICKAGQLAGTNECVQIGGTNDDECTITADCIHRINPPDDRRECRNDRCVCIEGFHIGNNQRCRETLGLRDACHNTDDCFQADSANNNALECAAVGNGMFCQCRSGYTEEGDRCNGSATIYVLSVSSLLLLAAILLRM